jgi:hypothetical protein
MVASGVAVFILIWWEQFPYSAEMQQALIFWPLHPLVQHVVAMLRPVCFCAVEDGCGTGARIRVERGVGGIVAITPIAAEVWMSSWWNDRGHVGSERGSCAPIHHARSLPSYRREWVPWLGALWLPVLSEGSTCPSGEAEVRPCLRCQGWVL